MNTAKFESISRIMMSYSFDIERIADNLKCVKCKKLLKDACQVPCGCAFCNICIDGMIANEIKNCPGVSEQCGESLLSNFQTDYRTNNIVLRLTVKCPNNGCMYECQLASMEEHLLECQRMSVECPFRELGCNYDELVAVEMNAHLYQENRTHSEILIGIIADINRKIEKLNQRDDNNREDIDLMKERDAANRKEIKTLKQRDEASHNEIELINQKDKARSQEFEEMKQRCEENRKEIELMKQKDKASSKEIEVMKQRDKISMRELDVLTCEIVMKNEEVKMIMSQINSLEKENELIKNDMTLIKNEKEGFINRLRILPEKLKMRFQDDEYHDVRVIDHINMSLLGIIDDIRWLIDDSQMIENDMYYPKSQTQSGQIVFGSGSQQVPQGLVHTAFEWTVDEDVANTSWYFKIRSSDIFFGLTDPYRYQLASVNDVNTDGALRIYIRIHPGPSDNQLAWPFEGRVAITVADLDRHMNSRSISRQCRIGRPPDNGFRSCKYFEFHHLDLIETGLDLEYGVTVSCVIVPGCHVTTVHP